MAQEGIRDSRRFPSLSWCYSYNVLVVLFLSLGLTSIFIIAIEIMNAIHFEDGFWIRRYDIQKPSWCEASYADQERFIMEPSNARSDYFFVGVGCWMMILALFDFFSLWKTKDDVSAVPSSPSVSDEIRSDIEIGDVISKVPPEPGLQPHSNEINGILRYPYITLVNGIFNILHGLGSFWYHACECGPGGLADGAGLVAVATFPIWYTPLQLLMRVNKNNSPTGTNYCHSKNIATCLSALPPIGQSILYFFNLYGIIEKPDPFIILSLVTVFSALVYIYCWRNKRDRPSPYQRHSLNLWIITLGLVLFVLAFVAWNLDKDGTWCFERSWFQGHAVWHTFSSGTLLCSYCFYRFEIISIE